MLCHNITVGFKLWLSHFKISCAMDLYLAAYKVSNHGLMIRHSPAGFLAEDRINGSISSMRKFARPWSRKLSPHHHTTTTMFYSWCNVLFEECCFICDPDIPGLFPYIRVHFSPISPQNIVPEIMDFKVLKNWAEWDELDQQVKIESCAYSVYFWFVCSKLVYSICFKYF